VGGYPGVLSRGVGVQRSSCLACSLWRSASELEESWNSWQNCWSGIFLGPDWQVAIEYSFDRDVSQRGRIRVAQRMRGVLTSVAPDRVRQTFQRQLSSDFWFKSACHRGQTDSLGVRC